MYNISFFPCLLNIFSSDYRTGPCYKTHNSGNCSDIVTGLRATKALCCATMGQAWGTSCEKCVTTCPQGFISDRRTGECIGKSVDCVDNICGCW